MWLDLRGQSVERNDYAMALGKAVALAQNFEGNCEFVATIYGLVSGLKAGELSVFGDEVWNRVVNKIRRTHLVAKIGAISEKDDELQVLHAGREARNRIVHDHGLTIRAPIQSQQRFIEQIRSLRADVIDLAKADNAVSIWSYEIQEKQGAPHGMVHGYVGACVAWVFSGVSILGN